MVIVNLHTSRELLSTHLCVLIEVEQMAMSNERDRVLDYRCFHHISSGFEYIDWDIHFSDIVFVW